MTDSISYGSPEFEVDLQQLQDAIGTIGAQRDAINGNFTQIAAKFSDLQTRWQGPAAQTYDSLQGSLRTATETMLGVLDDMVSRMQTTYDNYSSAENANTGNLDNADYALIDNSGNPPRAEMTAQVQSPDDSSANPPRAEMTAQVPSPDDSSDPPAAEMTARVESTPNVTQSTVLPPAAEMTARVTEP